MITSPLMTVRETAVELRLNIFSVYRLIESRRLPHIRIGRKILVDKSKLERWIERRAVPERQGQRP